jgi:hypothetical protein
MNPLLIKLSALPPVRPSGWFRLLPFQFAARYPYQQSPADESSQAKALTALHEEWKAGQLVVDDVISDVLEKHAWLMGRLLFADWTEIFWDRWAGQSRGAFCAGYSEIFLPREETLDWIEARLGSVTFHSESACQLACNLIWRNRPDLLARILNDESYWKEDVWRGDKETCPELFWSESTDHMSFLSRRCIDMILEAALTRRCAKSVDLALRHGANPNINFWELERNSNHMHTALGFALHDGMADIALNLVEQGADAMGGDAPGLPLYQALAGGMDKVAEALLRHGAVFDHPTVASPSIKAIQERNRRPEWKEMFPETRNEQVEWIKSQIGVLVPLVPYEEKAAIYIERTVGSYTTSDFRETYLKAVFANLDRLRRFENLGMDTRLSAEELSSAIHQDCYPSLLYLVEKHGQKVRDRVLFRIRHRMPEFGASNRALETKPQKDRINVLPHFDPCGQTPMVIGDRLRLYVDYSAIAEPDHQLGDCLEDHFWVRRDRATFRLRQGQVVMRKLTSTWEMVVVPRYTYPLGEYLPVVREMDGQFITLGISLSKLYKVTNDPALRELLSVEADRPLREALLDLGWTRVRAQMATIKPRRKPVLSQDELEGYPRLYWPYLIRLPSGFIGMTTESSAESPELLPQYEDWVRANKNEETFVPDPRLVSWDIWADIPVDFRPYYVIDSLFGRPTVRSNGANAYEKAMIHKAVLWHNDWMKPHMIKAIEDHQAQNTPKPMPEAG